MIKYTVNPQEVITYLDYHLPESNKSRHDRAVRCFNKGCLAMINREMQGEKYDRAGKLQNEMLSHMPQAACTRTYIQQAFSSRFICTLGTTNIK